MIQYLIIYCEQASEAAAEAHAETIALVKGVSPLPIGLGENYGKDFEKDTEFQTSEIRDAGIWGTGRTEIGVCEKK